MSLKTNKLINQGGNLSNADGTSKITVAYPPAYNWGLNTNDSNIRCSTTEGNPCPSLNADLVGSYGTNALYRYERCGCLPKSAWNCQPMKNIAGVDVPSISKAHIDSVRNFYPCAGDPPNYATCGESSKNLTENGFYPMCEYPSDAIPTDEQAISIYGDGNISNDEKKLLFNYCFNPSSPGRCLAPLTTCPKALSFDGQSICKQFSNKYNLDYDAKILEYCTNFYNKNKDDPIALETSGCKCVLDTNIKPDEALKNLITIPALANAAKCVWFPCTDSQPQNFNLSKDRNSSCDKNIKCVNLINLGGNVSNQGTLNQNVVCGQSDCNPACGPDETCDKISGICTKNLITTPSNNTTTTTTALPTECKCKIYEKCVEKKCIVNIPIIIGFSIIALLFLFAVIFAVKKFLLF